MMHEPTSKFQFEYLVIVKYSERGTGVQGTTDGTPDRVHTTKDVCDGVAVRSVPRAMYCMGLEGRAGRA